MLLEHPPTYTLGRRTRPGDLVYGPRRLAERGIAVFEVDRGGRTTCHAPGQLVGYPIMALGERYDVLGYLRTIEEAVIRTVAEYGVVAHRDPEHTGVWVGDEKLCAIGVKVTRGITMHGFALNVTTDLSYFEGIVPCGIEGRWVTSIAAQTGMRHRLEEVAGSTAHHLATVFDRRLVMCPSGELLEAAGRHLADFRQEDVGEGPGPEDAPVDGPVDAPVDALDCSVPAAAQSRG
jgi:lipoyl(octanoyl) transferase